MGVSVGGMGVAVAGDVQTESVRPTISDDQGFTTPLVTVPDRGAEVTKHCPPSHIRPSENVIRQP